jgi:hypothetical protein
MSVLHEAVLREKAVNLGGTTFRTSLYEGVLLFKEAMI